jgi:oligoendopeptidase F
LNILYASFEDARFETDLVATETCLGRLLGAQVPDTGQDVAHDMRVPDASRGESPDTRVPDTDQDVAPDAQASKSKIPNVRPSKSSLATHFEMLQSLGARVSEISSFVNLTLLTDQGHAGARAVYERSARIERDWLRVKNDFMRQVGATMNGRAALADCATTSAHAVIDGNSATDGDSGKSVQADTKISDASGCFEDRYVNYLKLCAESAAHMIPPDQEALVLEMQQTGSRSWQDLRNALDASAAENLVPDKSRQKALDASASGAIRQNTLDASALGAIQQNALDASALETLSPEPESESDSETPLSLPALRGLMTHPDREMRRRAFEAEVRCYKRYELSMAASLSAIKGEAMVISRLRGFPDVLAAMLFENRMDRDTLDAMLASVVRFLPAFHRYLKEKGRRMGLPNGLCYYDLLAPEGDAELSEHYTLEMAQGLLIEIFDDFHPEIGTLFRKAFAEGWIDADVRQGKVGGALCADLPTKGASRILVNFTGTSASLCAIAHEMGHAFHGQQLASVPLMFRDAPTPICETAGLLNETIFREAMLRAGSPDQYAIRLEACLAELAQGVVDIYSRFIFESEVFRRRKDHALDAEALNGMMEAAQQAAYGEGLCAGGAHPRMWVCKPHYYIPDYHYYNFPYIVGALLAQGLYAQYREEPKAFMTSYKKFLSDSCRYDVAGAALRIGIDLKGTDFWDRALTGISEKIEAYIGLQDAEKNLEKN